MIIHLVNLFNLFIEMEYFPMECKQGLIVTLWKGQGKKKYERDSYRGITLLQTIYKLFERLFLNRFLKWKNKLNIKIPHPLQSAYQKDMCSMLTSFILQETIHHSAERGSLVYCCFLDNTKAFDTVWHNGVFYKLNMIGIKGKAWRIMYQAY